MERRYHCLMGCIWVEKLTKYLALVFIFWCRTFYRSGEVQGDVGILTLSLEISPQRHVPLIVLSVCVPATCGSS